MGDIIAKSGNSGDSTTPHLHLEVVKNGPYLNPLFFVVTGDSSAGPIYGNPGLPMGDGSYAALITEAESHLGAPYVWGASGPNSFDCSGYVSHVLNHSGVASIGRQTAQGLYNLCVPIPFSEAKPGDLCFLTGTYSSQNPVTHVGIYVGYVNGRPTIVHAGDPVQYTAIDTSYYQSHLYAFGRIQ
jgi:cell wall-associated NlpC family hydrolase